MGEDKVTSFEPDFNRSVKIEFSDQRITSNAGVLLLREADSRLNLTNSIAQSLIDTRNQDAIRYQLGDLLRERIYAMALGYSAQDDLDRLAHDPAFRIAVWNRSGDNVVNERLASQPTQSRLLSMMANHNTNINGLRNGLFQSVFRHLPIDPRRYLEHGNDLARLRSFDRMHSNWLPRRNTSASSSVDR